MADITNLNLESRANQYDESVHESALTYDGNNRSRTRL